MMMRPDRGFTLVEVLVALVIMASGVMMLSASIGGSANGYGRIDEKTRAWMVAADKLVELQVYQQFPAVGTSDDRIERFGRDWRVRVTVSNGPFPDTRRVDIDVGPEEGFGAEDVIFWTQSSLLGKPYESTASSSGAGSGGSGSGGGSGGGGSGTGGVPGAGAVGGGSP